MQAGNFKSCSVESITKESTPTGVYPKVTVRLDYKTEKENPQAIFDDFKENYDSSGPTLSSKNNFEQLSASDVIKTKPLSKPIKKPLTTKVKAQMPVPDAFTPSLNDKNSQEFLDSESVVCSKLKQENVKNCIVNNFSKRVDATVVDLKLEYELDETNHESDVLDDLIGKGVEDPLIVSSKPRNVNKLNKNVDDVTDVMFKTKAETDIPFSPDMDNPSTKEFQKAEAITCGKLLVSTESESCYVKKFTNTGEKVEAEAILTKLTEKKMTENSDDVVREIRKVNKLNGGQALGDTEIVPRKVEKTETVADIKTSTLLPKPFDPVLKDKTSVQFKEEAKKICENISQASTLKSCQVSGFIGNGLVTLANLRLQYKSGKSVTKTDIIDDFNQSYDNSKGHNLIDPQVVATKKIPQSKTNSAKLNTHVPISEDWSPDLLDRKSDRFLKAEATTCASIQRASSIESCHVKEFSTNGSDVEANVNLVYETDQDSEDKILKEFQETFDSSKSPEPKNTRILNQLPKPISKSRVSTVEASKVLDKNWTKELLDDTSREFSIFEAVACSGMTKASESISKCNVKSFVQEGSKARAVLQVDYSTDLVNSEDIKKEFENSFDSTQAPDDISIEKTIPSRKPNKSEIKVSTISETLFSEELKQPQSEQFLNTQAELCAEVKKGTDIASCSVQSFTPQNGKTKANLKLDYHTHQAEKSKVLNEFVSTYDDKVAPVLDIATISPPVKIPPKDKIATLLATSESNEPWRSDLTRPNSPYYKEAEQRVCSQLDMEANGIDSCRVSDFELQNEKVVPRLKLYVKTDKTKPSEAAATFIADYGREAVEPKLTDIKPITVKPSKPKENGQLVIICLSLLLSLFLGFISATLVFFYKNSNKIQKVHIIPTDQYCYYQTKGIIE